MSFLLLICVYSLVFCTIIWIICKDTGKSINFGAAWTWVQTFTTIYLLLGPWVPVSTSIKWGFIHLSKKYCLNACCMPSVNIYGQDTMKCVRWGQINKKSSMGQDEWFEKSMPMTEWWLQKPHRRSWEAPLRKMMLYPEPDWCVNHIKVLQRFGWGSDRNIEVQISAYSKNYHGWGEVNKFLVTLVMVRLLLGMVGRSVGLM